MLFDDKLIVLGLAVISLGTIKEADGPVGHSFWLKNVSTDTLTLTQGYTSCGCTTITYDKDKAIAPGDSTQVTLSFNPRGKGGEFYESGTVRGNGLSVTMALEGTCIESKESLGKQYPIKVCKGIRTSNNRFDIGHVSRGQKVERTIAVLHENEGNRREFITATFVADDKTPSGLQHITQVYKTKKDGKTVNINVIFDVIIR